MLDFRVAADCLGVAGAGGVAASWIEPTTSHEQGKESGAPLIFAT